MHFFFSILLIPSLIDEFYVPNFRQIVLLFEYYNILELQL